MLLFPSQLSLRAGSTPRLVDASRLAVRSTSSSRHSRPMAQTFFCHARPKCVAAICARRALRTRRKPSSLPADRICGTEVPLFGGSDDLAVRQSSPMHSLRQSVAVRIFPSQPSAQRDRTRLVEGSDSRLRASSHPCPYYDPLLGGPQRARDQGFGDLSTFNHSFRRATGVAPTISPRSRARSNRWLQIN